MTDLDLSQSIIAKSDQVNADDLIAGPITVTISRVIKGSPEQPFDFQLVETPGRAYRPSKTMRRVIVEAWGPKTAKYEGRRLTLYREPSITFGGQKVGGIRISHMSDIAGPVVLAAQVTKGKRETFTVQPLADGPTTGGGGVSAAGAPESESPAPEEPLHVAVERQMDAFSPHQTKVVVEFCEANKIKPTRDGFIEAWGERARDIAECIGAKS